MFTKEFEVTGMDIFATVTVLSVVEDEDGYEIDYSIDKVVCGDVETGEDIILAVDNDHCEELAGHGYDILEDLVHDAAIKAYNDDKAFM